MATYPQNPQHLVCAETQAKGQLKRIWRISSLSKQNQVSQFMAGVERRDDYDNQE